MVEPSFAEMNLNRPGIPEDSFRLLNRKIHRPQLHRRDRLFWAPLATLGELAGGVDHHQTGDRHQMAQGFTLYWRWKSKSPVGPPKIDNEIRELIGNMSRENPLWGVPRTQAELRLLEYDLAESTVAKGFVARILSPYFEGAVI
jgi:hypothetical protein